MTDTGVKDMPGPVKSKKVKYGNVVATDLMKPWIPSGDASDTTDEEIF